MIRNILRIGLCGLTLSSALTAAIDTSNLNNCILDIRKVAATPPQVITFDPYKTNFDALLTDLKASLPHLPYVYQQAAAQPLIDFLNQLGKFRYLQIFSGNPTDDESATLHEIIPDAALAILFYDQPDNLGTNAFQEIVSDLYDSFLSEEARVSKQTGASIDPPTYGMIPPLVKFGNSEYGPYTWPADATSQILGMKCGVVSLPPEQLKCGLLAWSTLGHETGGHDVTHADEGLLDELANNVYSAIVQKFNSKALANYWVQCIDEASADVCGYLHMGPSLGFGLIGYFRALENGKLSNIGWKDDPHPVDLLRGFLAAAVVKRLNFKDAALWSQAITKETQKDKATLHLADSRGRLSPFPVSYDVAVASTDVVAEVIMHSKLKALQNHYLQELTDWTDVDQGIVDTLSPILKGNGRLPSDLQGSGFYAGHVVAAATQAALQKGANIFNIFKKMEGFLATMHLQNPTWSQEPNEKALALLKSQRNERNKSGKHIVHHQIPESHGAL